jgi:hypothetical protein
LIGVLLAQKCERARRYAELRGIKDSLPDLHDGRCHTLHDASSSST